MKITAVTPYLVKEWRTMLFVKIETDEGITGIGEAGLTSREQGVAGFIEALATLIVGQDAMRSEHLWQLMWRGGFHPSGQALSAAIAAIDIALWDIKGKAFNVPVVTLLGGALRERMRVYSSNLFQETVEKTVERAKRAIDDGHTGVKFGWPPFGLDEAADLRYVEGIRRAIGERNDFMLDVGQAWDAKTTIRRAQLFEPYRLFWIEEPLRPEDYVGYGRVSAATSQHIAAGEQQCTVSEYQRLIDEGGIDIVQIDITRVGLTQAMQIAAYAHVKGRKVCNHNFTTDFNSAASLHFLCAIPNALVMEYCVEPSELTSGLACNPVRIVDGYAHLPEEAGIGVVPNEAIVAKYLVK